MIFTDKTTWTYNSEWPDWPTHCACAHDMSIRAIQVEVTLYLGQTDPGCWDVESAYLQTYLSIHLTCTFKIASSVHMIPHLKFTQTCCAHDHLTYLKSDTDYIHMHSLTQIHIHACTYIVIQCGKYGLWISQTLS